MSQPIPRSIAPAEALVRGIVHPLFYSDSKNRLKPEALLPPPDRADVSVLRLAYTQAAFCKIHCKGLRIGISQYVGLAVLAEAAVGRAARQPGADPVQAVASPLNAAAQPVAADALITTADPGLPMHADLVYSTPTVRGTPNPALKLAARYLVDPARTAYYADPQPESEDWLGAFLQAPPPDQPPLDTP